jgi:chromosome segregation ATPase
MQAAQSAFDGSSGKVRQFQQSLSHLRVTAQPAMGRVSAAEAKLKNLQEQLVLARRQVSLLENSVQSAQDEFDTAVAQSAHYQRLLSEEDRAREAENQEALDKAKLDSLTPRVKDAQWEVRKTQWLMRQANVALDNFVPDTSSAPSAAQGAAPAPVQVKDEDDDVVFVGYTPRAAASRPSGDGGPGGD